MKINTRNYNYENQTKTEMWKYSKFQSIFFFKMMAGLECGHLYCTSCWTEYLTMKIVDEGASQMIECPVKFLNNLWYLNSNVRIIHYLIGNNLLNWKTFFIIWQGSTCNILVDDQTVMKLVRDPRIKLKYQHLITNSFVQVTLHSYINLLLNCFLWWFAHILSV